MKYVNLIFKGCITSILAWLVITIADAFDELVLDADSFAGIIVFFGFPIVMLVKYILHYIKNKPERRDVIVWFGSFWIFFGILWWNVYNKVLDNEYIIKQEKRTDGINLNGIEYIYYGFTALIGFSVLCILFHLIHMIISKCRK